MEDQRRRGLKEWAFVPGLYGMVWKMGCKAAQTEKFSKHHLSRAILKGPDFSP